MLWNTRPVPKGALGRNSWHLRMSKQLLIRDIYDAFQKQELERWKTMIAPDVTIDSPAGRGFKGLDVLTGWAVEFGGKLAYRIDLIDEHLALDAEGNGRGFFTFNLHWKHLRRNRRWARRPGSAQ